MLEFFIYLDRSMFIFFNQVIANGFFDTIMPAITDWDKTIPGRIIIVIIVVGLLWKGGRTGRTVIFLLIPTIILSDQLNSSFLKNIFARPRPCHLIEGTTIIENVRLLVACGSGYSFPSSHAVNSFAIATIFTAHYNKYWWIFGIYATVVSFSRIYVGVHFPFDVVAGAIVGILCSLFVYILWLYVFKKVLSSH